MTVRLSGLASGMDTDALIKGIMDAERLKGKRITDKQAKLEIKQDKWKELNAKLFKLYTDDLSKLRLQGNYGVKQTSSSNEGALSVKAGVNVPEGTHTVSINGLASAQYLTGTVLDKDQNGKTVTAATKLTDLGIETGTLINFNSGGESQILSVDANTTLEDFTKSAKAVGLNANFDPGQKRLFVSSKESGTENAFSISTASSPQVKEALELMGYKDLSSSGKKQISAAISALQNNDVDGSHEKAILLIKGHVERKVLKDIEKEVTDVIKAEVTPGAREAEIIKIKEEVVQKEINLLKEAAKEEGKTQEEIDGITEEDLDPIAIADLQNTAVEDSESRIQSAVNRAVQAELTLERAKGDDENRYILAVNDARNELDNNRFDLAAGQMDSLITAIKDAGVQAGDLSIMENLGLGSGAAKVEAKDANIIYNGAEFTLSSNEFTINGMTMTLKGLTQGESVSVNVANDTEAVYDMVKEFVKNYNDILKEMNELYNAPSGRDYAPLSDEDMEAMTDKQIEKWEGKIEESILRRDTTLGSVIDTLRITSMTSVNVGGKNMSLASFGIVTSSDYTEKGLLHIKGDADDAIFGSDNNVLMKMLREDPESLIEGLSKITSNLYDSMADKMKSIPNTRSAFTFYNDKSMDKQLKQYGKDVTAMEKKLKAIEDKYYKQFAVMETAMAKLQSQSNALASMMGMGQQQ